MAISRMQEPRQLYGLGSIVKKAVRGVKKVVKSPLGKAAIVGGLSMIPFGAPGQKASLFSRGIGALRNLGGGSIPGSGFLSKLNPFTNPNLSFGQKAFIGGGLGLTALPFLMDKFAPEEVEEEEVEEQIDVGGIRQSARDFYRGLGGKNLAFMPQKQYVQPNFYAAAGGRAMLNMGGQPGEQQAEQMLMMEYVKYKNKGGTLSFQEFVQAVMQASQQPEGAGMEQPVAMAANGGRIGYNNGGGIMKMASVDKSFYRPEYADDHAMEMFGKPYKDLNASELEEFEEEMRRLMNKFLSEGGRVNKQEGGIMEASEMIDMGGMEKDFRNEGGFVAMGGKERADDVPARLSKNEFVFTADAVRNAGGGDIDKGAEVMENLMNNLEQGGEVSEDSQGLEGAQAMYDQQQMLQSRVI